MKITFFSIYPDIASYGVRTISSVLKKEGHSVDVVFLTKEFYEGFLKFTTYTAGIIILIVVLMAIFLV